MISHSLSLCGMNAYRAVILEMAEQINALQEAVEDLQGLVSAEIMGGLAKPSELREVVAELARGQESGDRGQGNGRQPSSIPDGTVTGSSWLPDDWVKQYTAAVDGE